MQSVAKGFLLPPRSTTDILHSAFKAGVSLLFNQGPRDAFKTWMDKGVINEKVLLRADLGLARVLSLYGDLETPTLKMYGFKPEEFIEGAKPALQQFHEVRCDLAASLNSIPSDCTKEKDPSNSSTEKPPSAEESPDPIAAEQQLAALTALTGISRDNTKMKHLLQFDWKHEAEKDPSSLAGQLYAMVTPEFFDLIQVGSKTSHLLEHGIMRQEDMGEIQTLCLLSARSMVMDDSNQESKEFTVSEDELKVSGEEEGDDEPTKAEDELPVAAQVEVLYTIESSFRKNDMDDPNTQRTTLAAVGVFEGWLNGDPSGNKELRWRLSMNRPAWEFQLE